MQEEEKTRKENLPFKDPEFIGLKHAIKVILIITFIFLTGLLFFSITVQGQTGEDINFTFEDDQIYSNDNATIPDIRFNFETVNDTTTFFNATHTFTYEVGDIDTQIDMITSSVFNDADCHGEVIENFTNHAQVINFTDFNNAGNLYLVVSGLGLPVADVVLEFWFAKNETGVDTEAIFRIDEFATTITQIRFINDDLQYYDGGWLDVKTDFVNPNQWYHVSLRFEDSADRFDLYVNNVLEGNNLPYDSSSATGVNAFFIESSITATSGDYEFYVDAFGFTEYDPYYSQGDNFNPIEIFSHYNAQYLDEFAFDRNGNLNGIGDDLTDEDWGWYEDEFIFDEVNVIASSEPYDREIELYANTAGYRYIKNDYGINPIPDSTQFYFNITFSYLEITNPSSNIYVGLLSPQNSTFEIAYLSFYLSGGLIYLRYWNSTTGSMVTLLTWANTEVYTVRHVDFFVDDTLDTDNVILHYYDNNSRDQYFTLNKTLNEDGVQRAYIIASCDNNGERVLAHVDSATLFVNGTSADHSIIHDYSFLGYNTNITNWYSKEHNLFYVNGDGNFSAGGFDGITGQTISGLKEFTNNTFLFNAIDQDFNLSTPTLMFISNETFTINSLEIAGIKLLEGNNTYIPTYAYGNIDLDTSYYYVTGSDLRFYQVSDDNLTEYIEIHFDINEVFTTNRSARFTGRVIGESDAYFRLNYTDDTSTYINIKPYDHTDVVVLSSGRTIRELIILISDNGELSSGTSSGYVRDVELEWVLNYSVTIVTIQLLQIFVPLIIILLPTFAFYKKWGSSAVIPMLIIMSLVCFISGIIPTWVFFIIGLCLGALLFMQRSQKRQD
jgi:hypothetical protein